MARQLQEKDEQIQAKEQLLRDALQKQHELRDELASRTNELLEAKDAQLALHKQLRDDDAGAKRARVVNHFNTVNVNVVAFGKDYLYDHISDGQAQRVLQDPESSVPSWLGLALKKKENRNVRIPNVRMPTVQVFTEGSDGVCQWQPRPKQAVLAELVEALAMKLEGHAGEDKIGQRFSAWYERLLDDCESDGPMFKQQKALAFDVIAATERDEE